MNIDFKKNDGLVPVIIQDEVTSQVLMLGYMNDEAFKKTNEEKRVTFFSRSKGRLWIKGETSGNYLSVNSIAVDCDHDTLLISVTAAGPCCHNGTVSCFGDESSKGFLYRLEETISSRITNSTEDSYTNQLYQRGINKIAQKVGEEAVELVIEAKDDNIDLFKNEAADLIYHLLILLKAKGTCLNDVEEVLMERNKKI